jgi:hypothetical protein
MESYESIIKDSANYKSVSKYSNMTGNKRVSTSASLNEQLINTIKEDETNFVINSKEKWFLKKMSFLAYMYCDFSCIADEFFIGSFEDENDDEIEVDINEFNSIKKWGLISSFSNKVFLKSNIPSRNYDLSLSKKLFLSYTSSDTSHTLSIGESEKIIRSIKINRKNEGGIYLCVRNGFMKLKAETLPINYTWNEGETIEIDATDSDVLLSSYQFSSLIERSCNIVSVEENSGNLPWSMFIGEITSPGYTFIESESDGLYEWGVFNKIDVKIQDENNNVITLHTIDKYANENEILFEYFGTEQFIRMGSRNVYKTFNFIHLNPTLFTNTIHVKKGTILKLKVLPKNYNWSSSSFKSSLLSDDEIRDFALNNTSGIKLELDDVSTLIFPIVSIGGYSAKTKSQYFLEFESNVQDVYIGIQDGGSSRIKRLNTFNDDNVARVNVSNGNVQVQGSVIGSLSFNNNIKTLFIGLTRLSNGSSLFSFGIKGDEISRNIIIVNMVNPAFYITSNPSNANIGSIKLNPVNIIQNFIIAPDVIITQQTDISNVPNIYDVNSDVGSFRLSSPNEDEWTIYSFNLQEDPITANFSHSGYKIFIGLIDETSLDNGLSEITNSTFKNVLNKSGVLISPIEQVTQLIVNNAIVRNSNLVIGNDFFCQFTFHQNDICMSIGQNNFSLKNFKLPTGNLKLIFAVSKATFLFTKRPLSSILKTQWDQGVEIEFDAIDYNIQISSPLVQGDVEYFFNQLENTNEILPDISVVSSNELTLPVNTINFETFTDWGINYKSMKNCFLKRNNQDIFSGSSFVSLIEKSFYMRYGQSHESVGFPYVFLGSHPYQYVSNYITNNTILPNQFKFIINAKNTFLKIKRITNISWNDSVKENIFSIDDNFRSGITKENYNIKNSFKTIVDFEKTLVIGPFSSLETNIFCFEYETYNQNSFFGIISNGNTGLIPSFINDETVRFNLNTGDVQINNANSSRPIASNSHKTLVVKVYKTINGIAVSIGTSFLNSNQDEEIIGSFSNFSLYFTTRNITESTFLTLKRFFPSGISNESQITPNFILPSSEVPLNFIPFQSNGNVGNTSEVILSSNSDKWQVVGWDYTINSHGAFQTIETFGDFNITQYGNRDTEWFIGYTFKFSPDFPSNVITEMDDIQFENLVSTKCGVYFDGVKQNHTIFDLNVPEFFRKADFTNEIYTRMMFEMQRRNGSRSGAAIARGVIKNVIDNIIELIKAFFTGEIPTPQITVFEARQLDLLSIPLIGKSCFNASSFGQYWLEAYDPTILNLEVPRNHSHKFVLGIKNGSLSYQKRDVKQVSKFSIDDSVDGNIDLFAPSHTFVYKGYGFPDLSNYKWSRGFYIDDFDSVRENRGSCGIIFARGEEPSYFSYTSWNELSKERLSSQYFENLALFNALDYKDPGFIIKTLQKIFTYEKLTFDNSRDRAGDWLGLYSYSDMDYYMESTTKFLRVVSLSILGFENYWGTDYLVQEGDEYEFYTHIVKIPKRKFDLNPFKLLPFDAKFRTVIRGDNFVAPYFMLTPSILPRKFKYHNMDYLDNSIYKSFYKYTFNGETDEINGEKFSRHYLRNGGLYEKGVKINFGMGDIGYIGGTPKLRLHRSHLHNNEVSFISGTDVGCCFNFEIYGNQDVYFGIINSPEYVEGFEYRDTFTPLSSMFAYMNLRTGDANIAGEQMNLRADINTIEVKLEKQVGFKSMTIIKKFGYLSGYEKNIKYLNFGNEDYGYRFVITCQNSTLQDILIINSVIPNFRIK